MYQTLNTQNIIYNLVHICEKIKTNNIGSYKFFEEKNR